jgi:hypothetical protein
MIRMTLTARDSACSDSQGDPVCSEKELHRGRGRINGLWLRLYGHWAIEPTSMSIDSKLSVMKGAVASLMSAGCDEVVQ